MKRGIIALFAVMALLSCGNNNSSKRSSDKGCCVEIATKSEPMCADSCDSCATPRLKVHGQCAAAGAVEVLYLHGKQRCATCITIGKEAKALIEELGNSKVIMKTVDFSTPAGERIADKYEIASSSLIVVKGDKVDNVTAMSFQYARSNPEQFKANLKESIQKMLE